MKAYLVAHIEVHDPDGFAEYRDQVSPLVARFGGRYLIRGGTAHPVEGEWRIPRLVVIEFDNLDAARTFYHSPEYQEILPLRLKSSHGTAAFVEGVA